MCEKDQENINTLMSTASDLEIDNDSEKSGKYRVKNYIPEKLYRYDEKSSKLCNIVCCVVITILIIALIVQASNSGHSGNISHNINHTEISIKSENNKSLEIAKCLHDSQDFGIEKSNVNYFDDYELLVYSDKKFWSIETKTKKISSPNDFNGTVGALEICKGENIFFSLSDTGKIFYILSNEEARLMNRSLEILLEETRVKPQRMAYDYIGENLYIVDDYSGCLIVINLRNKNHDILLSNLIKPNDIEVIPEQGIMFILQLHVSILRGNMDGRSLENIIVSSGVSAMTIDRKNSKIYWVHDLKGIEVTDYSGKNLQNLMSSTLNIVDLAFIEDQLFWIWLQNDQVNNAYHVVSCQINDETCEGHEMQKVEGTNNPKFMKFLTLKKSSLNLSKITHPCQINNGGCQDICLLRPNGKRNCACHLGSQLNPDEKTCRDIGEFMIYTENGLVKTRILDSSRNVSVDYFWPTPYSNDSYEEIFFDYDMEKDNFYYCDGQGIFTIKLRGIFSNPTLLVSKKDRVYIKDLVLDWKNRILYYIQLDEDLMEDSVRLFDLDNNVEKLKSNLLCVNDPNEWLRWCSKSIIMNIKNGDFFLMDDMKNNYETSIYGLITNSRDLNFYEKSSTYSTVKFRSIAFDYDEERVYWIVDKNPMKIANMKTDGSDKKYITGILNNITTINVHRQWMYLSTNSTIWRVGKKTGQLLTKLVPTLNDDRYYRITDVRIISNTV